MIDFNYATFNQEVATGVTVVDFWAPWCGPCKQVMPMLEQLEKEVPTVKFGKVNIDSEPQLAGQFGVSAIPTVIIFENGEVREVLIGVQPKVKLLKAIQ